MKKISGVEKIFDTNNVKKRGRTRTNNYNRLGETTKRINRELESHRRKYGKTEEYQKIQSHLKGLKKEGLSQWNKHKRMWVLKTPRTKEGKEKVRLQQKIIQDNFLPNATIELARKLIHQKYGTTSGENWAKHTHDKDLISMSIKLAYMIQTYGDELIIGYSDTTMSDFEQMKAMENMGDKNPFNI